MTKKSASRLMRDAKKEEHRRQLENNQCWDELVGFSNNAKALLLNHTQIGAMAQHRELVARVTDHKTLLTNLRLFQNDLVQLNKEYLEIAAKHEGRTGGSQDPDVVMESIEIYQLYILWQERHDAVLAPTAAHILEQFGLAEEKLRRDVEAAAAAQQSAGDTAESVEDTAAQLITEAQPQTVTAETQQETVTGEAPASA